MLVNFIYFAISLCRVTPTMSTPIFGGVPVRHSNSSVVMLKYSHMGSLQEKIFTSAGGRELTFKHFCGGTLLNSKWILSAGHCLLHKNPDTVFAVVGYEDLSQVEPNDRLVVDRVEFISYQPSTLQNDISLVRLRMPHVRLVETFGLSYGRLPRYGMKAYRRNPCKIIGYGAKRHAGESQLQLHEGQVYVITNKRCRQLLGYVWAPQKGSNTVCALGRGQDTCEGDSGGPLLCKYDGVEYVYGIVSHGLACGLSSSPSVYTLTGPYVEWIHLVMEDE